MSPNFADFLAGVVEREGEAAWDIFQTFNDAVVRQASTVVLEPTGGK